MNWKNFHMSQMKQAIRVELLGIKCSDKVKSGKHISNSKLEQWTRL